VLLGKSARGTPCSDKKAGHVVIHKANMGDAWSHSDNVTGRNCHNELPACFLGDIESLTDVESIDGSQGSDAKIGAPPANLPAPSPSVECQRFYDDPDRPRRQAARLERIAEVRRNWRTFQTPYWTIGDASSRKCTTGFQGRSELVTEDRPPIESDWEPAKWLEVLRKHGYKVLEVV
jgi:hypothetical protein